VFLWLACRLYFCCSLVSFAVRSRFVASEFFAVWFFGFYSVFQFGFCEVPSEAGMMGAMEACAPRCDFLCALVLRSLIMSGLCVCLPVLGVHVENRLYSKHESRRCFVDGPVGCRACVGSD